MPDVARLVIVAVPLIVRLGMVSPPAKVTAPLKFAAATVAVPVIVGLAMLVVPEKATAPLKFAAATVAVPVIVGFGMLNADGNVLLIDGTPAALVTSTPLLAVARPLTIVPELA